MKIEITKSIPSRKHDIICCFFEESTKYSRNPLVKLAPPTAAAKGTTMATSSEGAILSINIDGYRMMEKPEARRSAGAAGLSFLQEIGGRTCVWLLDGDVPAAATCNLLMGALLFSYRFTRYKKTNANSTGQKLIIVAGKNSATFRKELKRLESINEGVSTARDLANTPAMDMTPGDLADHARSICTAYKMKYKELTRAQLERGKYIGLTSVGMGSVHPPVLFTMTHDPAKKKRGAKPLCLVGKGITFDSGGISIKLSEGMWDMKADMGGAAAVIGAMRAIASLNLPIKVIGVVAAAENLPDAKAYRPGDILTYRNGVTVEVRSTDAEGRLVLADALLYAQQTLKQRRIVDFATLTGACARALGQQYIGMLSRSPELAKKLAGAGEVSGDSVWELPMHPEYRLLLDSPICTMKNTGGPLAGASTAGWFLHEFIDEGTEFAHMDIAGSFLAPKIAKYWGQPGATGSGVRLAVCLAEMEAGISPSGT